MSVRENVVAKGCTVGSSRYVSSSKPKSRRTAFEELLLRRDRVVALEEGVVRGLAGVAHDRRQLRAEHVEDRLHLGRLHPRLVLVEEGVVGRVSRLHVLGPAERDVVDALERGLEDGEVVRLPRLQPGRVRVAALARPLRGQLGRNAARLLPVAAGDADQAGVVGVVVELGLERRELVEQPADLGRREPLVRDPREGGGHLGAGGGALRRHHRPPVPAGDRSTLLEVVDLCEPLLQVGECVGHRLEPTD